MKLRVPEQAQLEIIESIQSSSGLGSSYLILLLLSTLIATFGLISNSTATVIGAMIVAPLMGPILGIALSLVQGHLPDFRRALTAELVGVLVCLFTATCISKGLGSAHVDLSQSEIVGRTHPTLLDLAIGFAAGLAGAFATVNRKISASIAGVAIAVALVPPLCVSGLCIGAGQYERGVGAFVLFLANFLTIQLAASIVFALAGLGHWGNLRRERRLLQAFVVNLLLLLATGAFLTRQLTNLVAERRAEQITREITLQELSHLTGASLDALRVRLVKGNLEVEISARAPEEVGVSSARNLQKTLQQRLGYPVRLRIGTARASYVTPDGHLFLPEKAAPTEQEVLEAETQRALTQALEGFPGVELTSLRQLTQEADGQRLLVLLRSPYLFDSRLVDRLETTTLEKLQSRRPDQKGLGLTVRTTLVQEYTRQGQQNSPIDLPPSPDEIQRQEFERQAGLVIAQQKDLELLEIHVTTAGSSEQPSLSVDVKLRSPKPLTPTRIPLLTKALHQDLGLPLTLGVEVILGQSFRATAPK
ncbi:TIGR00341 family protein [bacterium]|nr:TIGR00341 family protein [bacterium]